MWTIIISNVEEEQSVLVKQMLFAEGCTPSKPHLQTAYNKVSDNWQAVNASLDASLCLNSASPSLIT